MYFGQRNYSFTVANIYRMRYSSDIRQSYFYHGFINKSKFKTFFQLLKTVIDLDTCVLQMFTHTGCSISVGMY